MRVLLDLIAGVIQVQLFFHLLHLLDCSFPHLWRDMGHPLLRQSYDFSNGELRAVAGNISLNDAPDVFDWVEVRVVWWEEEYLMAIFFCDFRDGWRGFVVDCAGQVVQFVTLQVRSPLSSMCCQVALELCLRQLAESPSIENRFLLISELLDLVVRCIIHDEG